MPQEITLIYASTRSRIIGNSTTNNMPWPRIKKDMQFFRERTTGNTIIMGRKTFESLGSKALPNRENIVITKQKNIIAPNCKIAHSLEEALDLAQHSIYIIGGAEIYRQAIPLATKILHTTIKQEHPGDIQIDPLPGMWFATELYQDDQILIEELIKV